MSTYTRVVKAVDELHGEIIEMVELYDLRMLEISGVDRPANLRDEWLLMKGQGDQTMQRVNKGTDGTMTTHAGTGTPRSPLDAVSVTDPQIQGIAKGFGAIMQIALGQAPEEVQKRLTLNRDAKDAMKDVYNKIYREMESTFSLLYSVEAEIGPGTLDSIMAKQCALLKEMWAYLEAKFLGQEAELPQEVTKGAGADPEPVEKRGRRMSGENLKELGELRDTLTSAADRLTSFTKRFENEPAKPQDQAPAGPAIDEGAVAKAVEAAVEPLKRQLGEMLGAMGAMADLGGGLPSLPAGNTLNADGGAEGDFGGPTRHHANSRRQRKVHNFSPRG
jgi:hypothetical protein